MTEGDTPAEPRTPKYRKPSRAPTAGDINNQDRFSRLAAGSLDGVRASAEKWRAGLGALVTVVTGGLLIKGPETASDLTTSWRLVLTLLAGGGIAAAIFGLWRALQAAAGVPQAQQFEKVVGDFDSVLAFELAQADKAAKALRQARAAVMIALPLLGAAVIAWWWAGTKPASPPAYVEVDRYPPAAAVCGTLESADNGRVRIEVAGDAKPVAIPLADVRNLRVKASC